MSDHSASRFVVNHRVLHTLPHQLAVLIIDAMLLVTDRWVFKKLQVGQQVTRYVAPNAPRTRI